MSASRFASGPARRMDLSFTPEEHAFALEVRAWLADERRGPAAVRDDRRRGRVRPALAGAARGRAAGSASTGPRSTAGAARRRSQVAIFNMEYARSRALQPINRVGINLAGPDAARARHRRAEGALAAGDPHRRRDLVPALQRARRGLRPRVADDARRCASTTAGCSRARRCGRRTRSSRGGGSAWRAPTPTCRSTGASRTSSSTCRRRASRSGRSCRSPARPSSTRCSSTRCSCPTTTSSAGCTTAGRWRTRRSRTSGARRSRSRSRSCTRCTSTSSGSSRRSAGVLDDVEIADALAQSFVELRVLRLHNWRTLSRLAKGIEPGPESSVTKLAWTDMTQALSARALDVVGAAAPLWWGADRQSRRRLLAAPVAVVEGGVDRGRHVEVQRTIIGERMLGLPASEREVRWRSLLDVKVVGFDHVVVRRAERRGARSRSTATSSGSSRCGSTSGAGARCCSRRCASTPDDDHRPVPGRARPART